MKLKSIFDVKKIFYNPITLFLVLLVLTFSIGSQYFLSIRNFYNIMVKSSTIGMLALGLAFVIMNGNIDLSVGSLLGLCGAVFVISYNATSLVPAIAITLSVGALVGLWNGFCVTVLGVNSFIVTLASMIGIKGITFAVTQEDSIGLSDFSFTNLSTTNIFGISAVAWVYILIALVLTFVHQQSVHGRNVLFFGGNRRAARAVGIQVDVHQLINFVICSTTVSVAAIVLISQLGAATPNIGRGYELWAITAVALGGVRLIGGIGRVPLVFAGGITIAVLRNGMNLMHISTAYIYIVTGLVLLVVMILDQYLETVEKFFASLAKRRRTVVEGKNE